MDTAELLERGARSLVVDLCKQLGDVVTAVPGLKRFAYSLARESVGMKPAGRALGSKNGDAKARLLSQLDQARKRRGSADRRGTISDTEKAAMKKRMRARWQTAKKLGYTGRTTPTNALIAKLKAKAESKPMTAPDAGGAAE